MMIALHNYLPKRFLFMADFYQLDMNRRIIDFKDGRAYATRWAAREMAYSLSLVDLRDVMIVCMPASTRYSYIRRFKRFSELLCSLCHAKNGFDMVHILWDREKKHTASDRGCISPISNVSIDAHIRGHKVLVIDDICTTGATANAFIDSLRAAGANVIGALFLAKTVKVYS